MTHTLRAPSAAVLSLVLLAPAVAPAAPAIPQADYTWTSVAMGGSGATPAVVVHPKVPDLAYIRTDVGGAYRWEADTRTWVPLLDHLPFTEWNLYGVDSLAVDPTDASGNTVYIATGKYTHDWAKPHGCLMKSTDRGRTWVRLPLAPTGGSNGDQGLGERIAVDPNNPSHVVYAARLHGLAQSLDAGASWSRIETAPQGGSPDAKEEKEKGQGLAFAAFDAASQTVGSPARTSVWYVGATNDGVYQTRDGGATWHKLDGGPAWPRKGVVAADGTLYVTHDSGVAKYAGGTWSDVTPDKSADERSSCGIATDPADPRHVLATQGGSHRARVFRSTDAGATWTDVTGRRNPTVKWWPGWHWFSNPFSLAFDPHHKNRVWATDWYGTYITDDVTAAEPVWTNHVKGHEEIVTVGALVAPRTGKYLLHSGSADIGGLDHASLTEAPDTSPWDKGIQGGLTRTGLAVKETPGKPNVVVTVGTRDWNHPGTGAVSLDGGETYTTFKSVPEEGIKGGRVVLPGKGRRILWVPQQRQPYYSDDLGTTWTPVKAPQKLAGAVKGDGIFMYEQPVVVDAADADRVYLYHGGQVYLSTDAGATFKPTGAHVPDGGANKLATSGVANDLWIAAGDEGLLRSRDGGKSFKPIAGVDDAGLFCFGKPAAGKAFPAVFVKGRVAGQHGYFRSDDACRTWVRIDSPAQRVGNDPNTMTGDWRVHGGVFIGTNGRGIYYGRPTGEPVAAASPVVAGPAASAEDRPREAGEVEPLPVKVPADDPKLRYVGRFDVGDPKAPRCAWSASSVTIRAAGASAVNATLGSDNDNDRWQVVVDGKPTQVLELNGRTRTFRVAKDLGPGEHTITLTKRVEPIFGTSQVHGFELSRGARLLPVPEPKLRLEVIGDSISAGYGNEAADQHHKFSHTTENAWLTYGAMAARALDAEYVCVAWSGKKMAPDNTIPEIYDRTLPWGPEPRWDFARWTPHVVVINLGTNDFAGGNPDPEPWVAAYHAFVDRVRGTYPDATIYCAVGPMLSDAWSQSKDALSTVRSHLKRIVSERNARGDARVRFIEFPMQDGSTGFGADWHPSVKTHERMAEQLVETIRNDLPLP